MEALLGGKDFSSTSRAGLNTITLGDLSPSAISGRPADFCFDVLRSEGGECLAALLSATGGLDAWEDMLRRVPALQPTHRLLARPLSFAQIQTFPHAPIEKFHARPLDHSVTLAAVNLAHM